MQILEPSPSCWGVTSQCQRSGGATIEDLGPGQSDGCSEIISNEESDENKYYMANTKLYEKWD